MHVRLGPALLWLLVGIVLSVLHLDLLVRFGRRLDPLAMTRSTLVAIAGYLVRYASLMAALILAARVDATVAIALAVGYGVARWVGVLLLARRTVGRADAT